MGPGARHGMDYPLHCRELAPPQRWHPHIHCLPATEGAEIFQNDKNCRTSVEMTGKYYAARIKTALDAAAINVMRPEKKKSNEGSLTAVA